MAKIVQLKKNSGAVSKPTGLHASISNLSTESQGAMKPMRVEPHEPAGAKTAKTAGGIEARPADFIPESSASLKAEFARHLHDIGRASYGDPEIVLETVHGQDDRVPITNGDPAKYPWSINASLLITARDGSQWIGTGWFISPRTLVTAGHCVYIKGSEIPGRDGWVKSMQVMPGRDVNDLPFGKLTSQHFFTVKGWADNGDENYDYGAIILPKPFTKDPGTIGYAVYADAQLASMVVNITGYPGDKPDGTLWHDKKNIASTSPSKVHYDIDTAGGQSGAAVYHIDAQNKRIGVAVHAYGGPTTNSGTRVSTPVFANFKHWSR
jgi:glutamyl endopeptidase